MERLFALRRSSRSIFVSWNLIWCKFAMGSTLTGSVTLPSSPQSNLFFFDERYEPCPGRARQLPKSLICLRCSSLRSFRFLQLAKSTSPDWISDCIFSSVFCFGELEPLAAALNLLRNSFVIWVY